MKPDEAWQPEDQLFAWTMAQLEAAEESDGMPETILINGPDQP